MQVYKEDSPEEKISIAFLTCLTGGLFARFILTVPDTE
jgi:hypothetical protein